HLSLPCLILNNRATLRVTPSKEEDDINRVADLNPTSCTSINSHKSLWSTIAITTTTLRKMLPGVVYGLSSAVVAVGI
ncbi:hypothetical protein PENTCL1PPCAC_18304, partial [Pristionchus entomophagus]